MSLAFDTKLRIPATALATTTGAASANYACGANAGVLVVMICYAGTTPRTGGAPTYNGVALTQAQTSQGVAETSVEMWYLLSPPAGEALTINVPNDGGRTMCVYVASATAAPGYTCAYDSSGVNAATGANPTVSLTAVAAATILFAVVATGDNGFAPSARTGTSLYEEDIAAWGCGAQYYVKTGTGSQAMSWTETTSDDYGAISCAFKEVVASQNYNESVSLGVSSGIADGRVAGLAPAASLPGTAALIGSSNWAGGRSAALPGSAALTPAGTKEGFGAAALACEAAFTLSGGLSPVGEYSLPVGAAITEAADLAALKELGLVCQAGINMGAALSIQASMSLSINAGVGEGQGGSDLFSGLSIPGAVALTGDGMVAAARSLSLTVLAGLPVAARADLLAAMDLPGAAALDLVASLLAEQALTLAGLGALNADGTVETGGGEYQQSISLAALAAAVQTALMNILASQTFPGAGGISAGAIVQATVGAALAAGGALTSAQILARLGSMLLPVMSGLAASVEDQERRRARETLRGLLSISSRRIVTHAADLHVRGIKPVIQ
jgi:hypothetical protein